MAMDAVHEEFVHCVAALQRANDAELPARLAELVDHALRHFSNEDRSMEDTGFPARMPHQRARGRLDSALAHWMCKQCLGGKPVVIRCGVTARDAARHHE